MKRFEHWKCAPVLVLCAALHSYGQDSRNPGGIAAPSRVEANMGQIDFRLYNGPINPNEGVLNQFCPPGTTTRRPCPTYLGRR